MRTHISRFLFALPLMILIGAASEARAQKRNHHSGYGYYGSGVSVGVGVGYGRGYGPYWGPGWGPGWGYGGWGVMPFDYGGFYGNGLSRYGPPVPTYKPIPGVFGGGDSRFFTPPPLYGPSWLYPIGIPLDAPSTLPAGVLDRPADQPLAVLAAGAPLELEIHVPAEAKLFVDGKAMTATGAVRKFSSPPLAGQDHYAYEVRAEWKVDGLTVTHTKRVLGRAGEKVNVEFGG